MVNYIWADKFLKQASEIIKSEILVTNNEGEVTRSSNKKGLGETNAIAKVAIKRKVPIEVEEENLSIWNTQDPCVTIPIIYKNEIYGTIIVKGHPNDIRTHTHLIKTYAEFTIAQDIELQNSYTSLLSRTQMLSHILFNQDLDLQKYDKQHTKSLLGLDQPIAVVNINIKSASKTKLKVIREAIQKWCMPNDDMLKVSPQEFVVIFKSEAIRADNEEDLKQFIKDTECPWLDDVALVTIGNFHTGVHGLVQSYKNAVELKTFLQSTGVYQGIHCYRENELKVFCCNILKQLSTKQEALINNYQKIIHLGKDNYLSETLQTYFKNHGKQLKTAQDLYIHRNTLNYRLKKINPLTQWDPNTIDGIVLLRLSQIFYELTHKH